MEMTKATLQEIVKKHNTLILVEDDLFDAIDLVWELLCAEADATQEKYPYAWRTIDNLEKAAYIVHELGYDISNEGYMEDM